MKLTNLELVNTICKYSKALHYTYSTSPVWIAMGLKLLLTGMFKTIDIVTGLEILNKNDVWNAEIPSAA